LGDANDRPFDQGFAGEDPSQMIARPARVLAQRRIGGVVHSAEPSEMQRLTRALGQVLQVLAVVPFIRTDAAIDPGNSDCPVFDGSGAVVGASALVCSPSGGYRAQAFATPIRVALKVKVLAPPKLIHLERCGCGRTPGPPERPQPASRPS
jgi:hypothetical protein